MNPLKLILTILSLVMATGCSTYLYTAYIPASAYELAGGFDDDTDTVEILMASVDEEVVLTNTGKYISSPGHATYTEAGLPANGDNGQIFADMRTATILFRELLKAEQVESADNYVLTRLDNGSDSEFVLIAAVYRPIQLIEVAVEKFPGVRAVITDKSPAFYEPYRTDNDGRSLDKIVAWSLVPVNCFTGPEQQEVVLKDTAGLVLEKNLTEEFWTAREQWANGDVGVLLLAGNVLSCPARASVQG